VVHPWLSYNNSSVNYSEINNTAYQKYASAFSVLKSSVWQSADAYAAAIDTADASGGVYPRYPSDAIRAAATNFVSGASGGSGVSASAIKDSIVSQIKKLGFLSLGSYYSVFAQVNTALASAQNAAEYQILTSDGTTSLASASGSLASAFGATDVRGKYVNTAAQAMQGSSGTSGSDSGGSPENLFSYDGKGSTGGFGQTVLKFLIGAGTTGTGDPTSMQLIDPIISAKNLGDWLMVVSESVIGAPVATKILSGVLSKVPGVGAVASAAGGAVGKIASGFDLGGFLAKVTKLAWIVLFIGLAFSIYIPFVPFMNWISATVQYVAVVIQAFAAAPIWAFSHVSAEGEGMGQRAERGYVWLLLVLFKPSLMVIAFSGPRPS